MNDRLTPAVPTSTAGHAPEIAVEPGIRARIVVRRIVIIALLVVLVAPPLWSAVTGHQALKIDGASSPDVAVIALVAPAAGAPRIGETVAVPASKASSVAVGLVHEVTDGTIALRGAVRPDNWTASVAEVRGTVLALFDGPLVAFIAGLPPLTTSAAIILLIIALVAIPLRATDPDDVLVNAPSGRHFREFSELSRG